MNERAKKLHETSIVVDGHEHFMIGLDPKRSIGGTRVFSREYAPVFRQGGIKVLNAIVGADAPSCCAGSDNLLWGTLKVINSLLQEAEESSDTLRVCTSYWDIRAALKEQKIAVIMGIEGGRPLEGKANYDSVDILQILYRLGLRQVQLCDFGRNRIGDGLSTASAGGGLTPFGRQIVTEMNRLGMIVDTAHLNDEGFWDVIQTAAAPVVDSHTGVAAVCADYSQNISDERLKALAATGGVLGVSVYDIAMMDRAAVDRGERPTVKHLVRHLEHVVEVAGIDHVALGSDHFPDHGFYPVPGWCEGTVNIGVRDSYYIEGIHDASGFGLITQGLVEAGWRDEDIQKVMGLNLMRVYEQILK